MNVEQAMPRPVRLRPHRPRWRCLLGAPASGIAAAWRWMTGDRPGYVPADTDMWLLVMAASDCDGTWLTWPPLDAQSPRRSHDDDFPREEPVRLPVR
jgi:hypothetical protein